MDDNYSVLTELDENTFIRICLNRSGKVVHEYYEETKEGDLTSVATDEEPAGILSDIRYAGTFE